MKTFTPLTKTEIRHMLIGSGVFTGYSFTPTPVQKLEEIERAAYTIYIELNEEEAIEAVTNGDDLVSAIARAQIGFVESTEDYDLDEMLRYLKR